jgi:DNA-binding response OmpR family regulator
MADLPGVLVVEDEAMIAFDLADALESFGWRVIGPVGTLADALAAADDVAIDVAVLDINLGRGKSFEVAAKLTARRVPVIYLTGDGTVVRASNPENGRVIAKPVDYRELHQALLDALAL